MDELLDLSRLRSGQAAMSRAGLSLSELVGLCGELPGVRAREEGACLEEGTPGDNLGLVFDRSYQGAGVRTGAGLRLAIARETVRAHGGSIGAAKGIEKGAVFTVRLPTGHRQATWRTASAAAQLPRASSGLVPGVPECSMPSVRRGSSTCRSSRSPLP